MLGVGVGIVRRTDRVLLDEWGDGPILLRLQTHTVSPFIHQFAHEVSMDSERRHQLSQNDLANWLLEFYEETFRPNASLFLLGGTLAVVVVGVFFFYTKTAAANRAAAWQHYNEACSAGGASEIASLESLATFYTQGEMGATIRFTLAEAYLAAAGTVAGRTRPETLASLEKAIGLLDAASQLTTDAMQQGRIAYDRGMVCEMLSSLRTPPADATPEQLAAAKTLCESDLTAASNAYQKVLDFDPQGVYALPARARLEAIGNPITREALIALATTPLPAEKVASEGGLEIDTQEAPKPPASLNLDSMFEE